MSYTVLNLILGKGKNISALMYVMTVLFVLKYFLI